MGKGRAPCCDKTKVRTGPWSPAEDLRLMNFIQKHGHSNWRALPKQAGLLRCGKSCRLRWINYLRPDVKRGNFTPEEENTIIQLHNTIGNKWSKIASCLPGRTDNEIKNVWNTHLKKRVVMTNKSEVDRHKTEGNKDSKMEYYSASSSCTSSSITTTGDDNMEKLIGDDQVQQTQLKEKPEFIQPISSTQLKLENALSDSPSSDEATIEQQQLGGGLDNGKIIDVWSEFDVDFWEMLDSLDPTQSNKTAEIVEEKSDGEVEFGKWLRFMENELGLTSDGDQQMMITANPEYQDMRLEPEISTAFDYSLGS